MNSLLALKPLIIALLTFFMITAYFKYKLYIKMRKFKQSLSGKVNDVVIENNKMYFIVKWSKPQNLKSDNLLNVKDNIGYYKHFARNTPKNIPEQYLNKYITKHIGRSFILKGKIENDTLKEIMPLDNPGFSFLSYLILSIVTMFILINYFI